MKSPRHRAWLLDPRVKTAATGISKSRHGTFAAWSFSGQPLLSQLRNIGSGFGGWLTRMFRPHYRVLRDRKGKPLTRPLPEKPNILGWLARVFKWAIQLLSISLVLLGVHGFWVYFSGMETASEETIAKLFLTFQVPAQLQSVIEWMSALGLQHWFFPTTIIVTGIFLWWWLVPIIQRRI